MCVVLLGSGCGWQPASCDSACAAWIVHWHCCQCQCRFASAMQRSRLVERCRHQHLPMARVRYRIGKRRRL